MGVLCEHLGADSHAVMDVFCEDTKLNISRAYLKPGFAFGGSCLPKDLRAIQHRARHADEDLPVLQSILRSNDLHIKRAADVVRRSGSRQIGMVGLSFKPETDDLRESPLVSLIELLIGRGLDVRVFDPEVALSRVMGGNRAFIDRTIPHITNLMCESLDDLVTSTELVIVGKPTPGLNEVFDHVHRDGQVILDLARHWGRSIEHVAGRPIVRLC
jgi:GDP-mannose 6-dehydrogenase